MYYIHIHRRTSRCYSKVFKNEKYNSWFRQLRDTFLPVLINTTYDNVNILNQVKGEIPECDKIDLKTVDNHYFCYQWYIYVPDLLFQNLSIRDKNMNHIFCENKYHY